MSNQMKAIIGSAVALIVLLIVVFTGGSDSNPKDVAKDFIAFGNKTINRIENINNKEDMISTYKETITSLQNLIPRGLAAGKQLIDQEMNGKLDIELANDPGFNTKMMSKYSDIFTDGMILAARLNSLDSNREKLETIFSSLTEQERKHLTELTFDVAIDLIENIANDADALEFINIATKANGETKTLTKGNLLDMVKEIEEEISRDGFEQFLRDRPLY